mmetsp:Transcript_25813/g.48842  ORF Transcript_25813/g.48842 Transcript_25813/m.48842 type:complete len:267 (-) Transcript_25813:1183-1983(-)
MVHSQGKASVATNGLKGLCYSGASFIVFKIKDGGIANLNNSARLVDKGDRNGITTDKLFRRVDVSVFLGPNSYIDFINEDLNSAVGLQKVIFDLNESKNVRIGLQNCCYKFLQLTFIFSFRSCPTGTTPIPRYRAIVKSGEKIENIKGGNLVSAANIWGTSRTRISTQGDIAFCHGNKTKSPKRIAQYAFETVREVAHAGGCSSTIVVGERCNGIVIRTVCAVVKDEQSITKLFLENGKLICVRLVCLSKLHRSLSSGEPNFGEAL